MTAFVCLFSAIMSFFSFPFSFEVFRDFSSLHSMAKESKCKMRVSDLGRRLQPVSTSPRRSVTMSWAVIILE